MKVSSVAGAASLAIAVAAAPAPAATASPGWEPVAETLPAAYQVSP